MMFQMRRTAFRLLTSTPSRSFLTSHRSLPSLTTLQAQRVQQKPSSGVVLRWISSEAQTEAKTSEETAIIEEEPSQQEEAENDVHAGNAVSVDAEESAVNAAVNSAKEAVSGVADTVTDAINDVTGSDIGKSKDQGEQGNRRLVTLPNGMVIEPKSTVYVGNLFFDVTEEDVRRELGQFGKITHCRLLRDARGLSKGFGYVDFETIDEADAAIEALHQKLYEGRRLVVQYAAFSSRNLDSHPRAARDHDPKPLNPPSKTLFIGNMSFEMTDRDLNNLFRGIKNVIDVRVAIDRRTGQPRGFAHADFTDVESAQAAVKLLANKETYGRKLRLDFSYSTNAAPRNRGTAEKRSEGESGEDSEDRY